MAIKIKFDGNHQPILTTFALAERDGRKLGALPASNVNFSDHMASPAEIQFSVYKSENGARCAVWDSIIDFKLVWAKEWDAWFEIQVEIEDGDETVKRVSGKALGEAELSQINLYGVEINTETDIARDGYAPTTLYKADEHGASLLHRITQKAPHYTIGHVDASIAGLQRTFEFDGTSIMDALNEIAEELDCLFVIDNGSGADGRPARKINAYDLENTCNSCGYRGIFSGSCPKCDSADISYGYGENTNIYISPENLTDKVTYTSNADSMKNCFRLVAGDDLMTAVIASCNPNGSSYLWYIPTSMRSGMSTALQARLTEYDDAYAYYRDEHEVELPQAIVTGYNDLVDKYSEYRGGLSYLPGTIAGHAALMASYYNAIDLEMLLKHELMPSPEMSVKTAQTEVARLIPGAMSPTAVTNVATCSEATATSAVQIVAKSIIDGNYQVRTSDTSLSTISATTKRWSGRFTVTSYSDDEDTATGDIVEIDITDDQRTYLRQRIDKVVAEKSDDVTDIGTLFGLELAQFVVEIQKYCLTSLISFHDACQACLDILLENGVANQSEWALAQQDLYTQLYKPYYDKLIALETEMQTRESEIALITGRTDENGGVTEDGVETLIQAANDEVHAALDFEAFVGETLYKEMAAYRREDTYENDNFISDGLNNDELVRNALEFIARAEVDIYKSAQLQHSISATLKNLLVIREFAPIVDAFEVGNWLSIRVDDEVHRLRLLSYEIDFDNLDELNVEFSDVSETIDGISDAESIFKSAASIATSYEAVKRQAAKGDQSQDTLARFGRQGMPLTAIKIVDDAEEQNISIDSHGILARRLDPITEVYGDMQLRVTNTGVYITRDNWESASAAIGRFKYYDPADGVAKTDYGVVANTLIGNYVLAGDIGVFNEAGSVRINEDGIRLISTVGGTTDVFRIQKQVSGGTPTDVIWMDNSGNAHFSGTLEAAGGTFDGTLSADCINGGTLELGGAGNAAGEIIVRDASGHVVGSWNNEGVVLNDGSIHFPISNARGTGYIAINENGVPLAYQFSTEDGSYTTRFHNFGISMRDNDDATNHTYAELYPGQFSLSDGVSDSTLTPTITVSNYLSGYDTTLTPDGIRMYGGGGAYSFVQGHIVASSVSVSGDVSANRLFLSGSKTRVVGTDQYGDRLLYCYETPTPMFGDIGDGVINEDGLCYIAFDAVFAQTVTTMQYQVFLQKYGDGDCWVKERNGAYFIVEGTPGLAFGWEIKAKQRDYDQMRLEKYSQEEPEEKTDYAAMAAEHITKLRNERVIQ